MVELEISGLDRYDNEESIRQKLRKEHKHIVSVKPKVDFLTNTCTGSAKVMVRMGASEKETGVFTKLDK